MKKRKQNHQKTKKHNVAISCNLLKRLKKICPTKTNQDLSNYCTIKIGGIGRYICFVKTIRQTKKLLLFLNKHNIKYFVLGNGSNVVFEDSGFSGVIVHTKYLNKIYTKSNRIVAGAGVNLFALNYFCAQNALGGLEFSYGIPASVGGAVAMNAGAYGGEMQDVVSHALVCSKGKIKKILAKNMDFGYRHSIFLKNNDIILRVVFKLKNEDKDKIKLKQQEIFARRLESQPYGTLNSGSVFKRVGEGAGKIIDKIGLKSVTIGEIQISPKHANFFVNIGHATSQHLHSAIEFTKEQVRAETGIELEQEIIFVGD